VSPPGYEIVRRLKQDPTTRNVRVVMVTSLQEPEHRRKVEQAGVDAYIVTPVGDAELEVMLQELVQQFPVRSEGEAHGRAHSLADRRRGLRTHRGDVDHSLRRDPADLARRSLRKR
jgi:PleD family two-component response regulator